MKKFLALVLALCMVFSLCACGSSSSSSSNVKAAIIALHDENSTYDANFINAFKEACEAKGVQYTIKTGVGEDQSCYDTAADLADDGYNVIFSDSYGHQSFMLDAAKEFPKVQFISATGDMATAVHVANYHNAFADIYQGRYLVGVAAGLKLQEMLDNGVITEDQLQIGYVGAYTYAEVVSGLTSFYLGVKSIVPAVTMKVTFTGSWYDEALEKEAANNLISQGCVLISQHADSYGAPSACEAAGVPNISYNIDTSAAGPNTYIASSRINWVPYFNYMLDCMLNGTAIDEDWCGTLETGSVEIISISDKNAAAGTAEKLEAVKKSLLDGSLKVFDTSKFTVSTITEDVNATAVVDANGTLTSYTANAVGGDFAPDTEAVANGEFTESVFRSAPYFDLVIDGITFLDTKF